MENRKLKTTSLEVLIDKHIGKIGTKKRDEFENELRLDLVGQAIKQARQDRNLTQEQLGELVGVKKAQISKIENSTTDARFETILKVIRAIGENFQLKASL
mgnify:CR=1 FL=1